MKGLNNPWSSIVIYLISDTCGIILINSCTDELFYESKASAMNSFWETLCPFYYAHYVSWEQKFFPVKMIIKSSL